MATETNLTFESLFEAARQYVFEYRWSVIPIKIYWNEAEKKFEKKPVVKWTEFQSRRPTEDELKKWFSNPSVNGVGIVTGQISHLAVIDLEKNFSIEKLQEFKSPIITKTISGGRHFYYKLTEPLRGAIKIDNLPMDLRADGNFVAAPPSSCDGQKYEWEKICEPMFLNELPTEFKNKVRMKNKTTPINFDKKLLEGVSNGSRNVDGARIIGKLIHGLSENDFEDVAWPFFQAWNLKNQPPLEETNLRKIFLSITESERRKRRENAGEDEGLRKVIGGTSKVNMVKTSKKYDYDDILNIFTTKKETSRENLAFFLARALDDINSLGYYETLVKAHRIDLLRNCLIITLANFEKGIITKAKAKYFTGVFKNKLAQAERLKKYKQKHTT